MKSFGTCIAPAVALLLWAASGASRPAASPQQAATPPPARSPWADWIEPDFPFFSSVIDARKASAGSDTNLTPRGLVLQLGRDHWVGFDTDLLRVAVVWHGKALTPKALAPGSYHDSDRKTPGGQSPSPEPDGKVWLGNGIYPGWQSGERLSFDDPREPAPSPEEVGRGPLSEDAGRFKAIHLVQDGAVLEYTAGGAPVREWMTAADRGGRISVERHFRVGASAATLWLVLGTTAPDTKIALCAGGAPAATLEQVPLRAAASTNGGNGAKGASVWAVRIQPHQQDVSFCAALGDGPEPAASAVRPIPAAAAARRWPQELTSKVTLSTSKQAFVVDDVSLPVENPWRRNIRMSDIQFLEDGTGVGVTLDGDVWLIRGLNDRRGVVRWRRFTSGLHEPLTLAIRDEQIYVYDRNGIWRLRDTNGDEQADVHELFSNAFAQTADMREFPNTIRRAPGGEFVIAKGNQQATTIGKHNGHVLRISADGRRATVLGYGFRQPNLGVNVRTGLVTASDQQGHYIPTTPLHVVRDGQFYGFLSDKQPREVYPAPIADPITWIPHAANASAMSQVWLFNGRMGPLNDDLVHIGFNNPEIFRVLLNDRGKKPQGALVSITRAFDFPPLNGSVNPADGQLYITGFQILGWGTTAPRLAGLGRVRYTGAPVTVPRAVIPMDKGVLLAFDVAVDANQAVDPDNYSLTSWNYQRTYRYGSPQFKADGKPGIDRLAPSSAYLSKDGRRVFIGVPGMKPAMQMRLGWSLATAAGEPFQESAYFTPYELTPFDPRAEGFGDLTVDLSPRAVAVAADAPVSAAEGRRYFQLYGCSACHSIEPTSVSRIGPTLHGLHGRQRSIVKGVVQVVADDDYIRESIVDPSAKIVTGFERGEAGMPSYSGVLTDSQIESIILFIKSLK
jgi:cytochrome c2/glucose/arabinose dehydrogenase